MQAPHPPLLDYYAHEDDRRSWVRQLFDRTAGDYDRVERLMALGSGSRYRRMALWRAGLVTGATAGGPCCDRSSGLRQGAHLPANVKLLLGSAESIPMPADSADFLSM